MARRRLRDVLAGRSVDDVELGTGVWRRAHDRFRRAVDRYHQVIEPVPRGLAGEAGGEPGARDRLEVVGGRLAACLDAVRARAVAAQQQWPSSELQVPGGAGADEHHRLSRAATLAAQAAEAATMVRVAARDPTPREPGAPGTAAARCAAVERAATLVEGELRPSGGR